MNELATLWWRGKTTPEVLANCSRQELLELVDEAHNGCVQDLMSRQYAELQQALRNCTKVCELQSCGPFPAIKPT